MSPIFHPILFHCLNSNNLKKPFIRGDFGDFGFVTPTTYNKLIWAGASFLWFLIDIFCFVFYSNASSEIKLKKWLSTQLTTKMKPYNHIEIEIENSPYYHYGKFLPVREVSLFSYFHSGKCFVYIFLNFLFEKIGNSQLGR